jgi:hypothetical protein
VTDYQGALGVHDGHGLPATRRGRRPVAWLAGVIRWHRRGRRSGYSFFGATTKVIGESSNRREVAQVRTGRVGATGAMLGRCWSSVSTASRTTRSRPVPSEPCGSPRCW